MQRVYNRKLKACFEAFSVKAFEVYNATFNGDTGTYDGFQIFMVLHQQEENLKKIDEFKKCVQELTADAKVSQMLGKLVGTLGQKSAVGDADMCVFRFVERLYIKKPEFDQDLFDEQYFSFEELFYSDVLRFVDTARLNYFESEVNEIELEKGLLIKKSPRVVDEQAKIQEMTYRPHRQFSQSEFIIERKYTRPKRIDDGSVGANPQDADEANKEMTENIELFDLVIKALRILKSSAVFRDQSISTEELTFNIYGGISSRFSFIENLVFGDRCILSKHEGKELKRIFSKLRKEKDSRFRIASNRLSYGLERQLDEDKVLDYMIGLESLYLPDGNAELTFRLSLRVGFVTRKKMAERKKIYKFIKMIYNQRSKIVHGKENKLTQEDVKGLEDILRESLKIFLEIPQNFTLDKTGTNGVIKEGVLDNIFFKK